MHNKRGRFFGVMLSLLMLVVLLGLFATKLPSTGFATKSTKCFEGTEFDECSYLKPKYCDNGALKPNCQKCGCNVDEVCQDDGNCLRKCSDGTLFTKCSENKPLLCHKGNLLENCFKCGCFPGQTCSNDGTCIGDRIEEEPEEVPEVIEETLLEEVPEVIEETLLEEEPEVIEETLLEEEPEVMEEPKVGFFWDLFCRIFYYDGYDDCISDVVRKQNK